MANYLSIIIGAYIEVPDLTETVKKTVRECVNPDCSNPIKKGAVDFCPSCGKAVESVEKTIQVDRKFFWHSEDMGIVDDTFHIVQSENSSFLFSNSGDMTKINAVAGTEESSPRIISDSFPVDAKTEFANTYKDEIEKIQSFYNQIMVVGFGVVKYYS